MADEIAHDVTFRRMEGPFTSPSSWPKDLVPADVAHVRKQFEATTYFAPADMHRLRCTPSRLRQQTE